MAVTSARRGTSATAARMAWLREEGRAQIPEWYFTLIGDGDQATLVARAVAATRPTRKRRAPWLCP